MCVIASSVLGARAFLRTRTLAASILALKAGVEVLDQRVSQFGDRPSSVPEEAPREVPPPEAPVAPTPPAPAGKSWEKVLVGHWLVWLGGVALGLTGHKGARREFLDDR